MNNGCRGEDKNANKQNVFVAFILLSVSNGKERNCKKRKGMDMKRSEPSKKGSFFIVQGPGISRSREFLCDCCVISGGVYREDSPGPTRGGWEGLGKVKNINRKPAKTGMKASTGGIVGRGALWEGFFALFQLQKGSVFSNPRGGKECVEG